MSGKEVSTENFFEIEPDKVKMIGEKSAMYLVARLSKKPVRQEIDEYFEKKKPKYNNKRPKIKNRR